MARRILLVAHPGALGVELLGVRDILEMANAYARGEGRPEPFAVEFATHDGGPVSLWAGLKLGPVRHLRAIGPAIDTLIVVGGPLAEDAADIPALVAGVRMAAARSRRVVGVCTGAFILGAAGLLDGRRCTTHWAWGEALAARYPRALVDTKPIFIDDGDVWTSAGVTSGFDMLLALVEQDAGAETARHVCKTLVLYLHRSGNQSQFTGPGRAGPAQVAHRASLRALQQYIADNPAADLSVGALARRVNMSPRHFARVFRAELGTSPHSYVEQIRLQIARRLLEETDLSVEAVAGESGFGSYETIRRAFSIALDVAPKEYRRRFGSTPAAETDAEPLYARAATR
jgi:transcriptional regulator GlxA family with amidase domain